MLRRHPDFGPLHTLQPQVLAPKGCAFGVDCVLGIACPCEEQPVAMDDTLMQELEAGPGEASSTSDSRSRTRSRGRSFSERLRGATSKASDVLKASVEMLPFGADRRRRSASGEASYSAVPASERGLLSPSAGSAGDDSPGVSADVDAFLNEPSASVSRVRGVAAAPSRKRGTCGCQRRSCCCVAGVLCGAAHLWQQCRMTPWRHAPWVMYRGVRAAVASRRFAVSVRGCRGFVCAETRS